MWHMTQKHRSLSVWCARDIELLFWGSKCTKQRGYAEEQKEGSVDLFQPPVIHGQQVEQVDCFKYLGTEIDSSLSFGQHEDCF